MDAAHVSHEGRGFAKARNAKLHLLAKKKRHARPAASAQDETACSPSQTSRPVRLSEVLQASPQYFDSLKVSCVERGLTVIDELPSQYHTAEVLYLSKNNLQALQGIEQFSQLRVLSASDNLLEDIAQLQILQDACCNLQVASFERNPITCLPNYRNKVIQMLPKLQMLDGQGVSSQDRQRAAAALKQEAACMAVMVSNACMVHKLVRSAELLQLHTELRRALFGSAAALRKSFLPSAIPLDLLRFLRLWDYEGGLSAGDRGIITDALTREVVRVHRQLQHAAAQLKGPAQLPELQAWDAAFSQVMLAQQRTIIQVVELVNILHDEAMRVVTSLTPVYQDRSGTQAQEEQEAVQQQHQQEREGLIVDLRDAALELAGVLASNSPPLVDGTADSSAEQYAASPMQLQKTDLLMPHEQQQQPQSLLQQATAAQEQLALQLNHWSLGSQQQQHSQHGQSTAPRQQPMHQESECVQLQQHEPKLQQRRSVHAQKPARRLSSNDSLRLRPVRTSTCVQKQQQSAAVANGDQAANAGCITTAAAAAAAAAAGHGVSPVKTRTSPPDSPLAGRMSVTPTQRAIPVVHQQRHYSKTAVSHVRSSVDSGLPGSQPLSPTAQRLLQHAAASGSSQRNGYHQWQPLLGDDEAQQSRPSAVQQLAQQFHLQPHQALIARQQQGEWMEAGFSSDTPQGPKSSVAGIGIALETADAVGYTGFTSEAVPAGGVAIVALPQEVVGGGVTELAECRPEANCAQQQQEGQQQSQAFPEEQRQSQSSLSLPASSGGCYEQQQSSALQQQEATTSRTGTPTLTGSPVLQLSEVLPYLAHNNVVYERIERFTPASAAPASPAAGSGVGQEDAAAATAAVDDHETGLVDVPAMVAAAQTAARQLFAVEEMPGACGFFGQHAAEPIQAASQQQQQQQAMQAEEFAQQLIPTLRSPVACHANRFGAVASANITDSVDANPVGTGEISFAYGRSSTSSPEAPRSPSGIAAAVASQQQRLQQQQQQQQLLLQALLTDDESSDEATAGDAAFDQVVSADPGEHRQQQLVQASGTWLQHAVAPSSPPASPSASAANPAGVAGADASCAAALAHSPLSRGSSFNSSGDLSMLRQRLFASIAAPSPSTTCCEGTQGRPSGLADLVIAQQQQQQPPSAAVSSSSSRGLVTDSMHVQQQALPAVGINSSPIASADVLSSQTGQGLTSLATKSSSLRLSTLQSLQDLQQQQQQQEPPGWAARGCSSPQGSGLQLPCFFEQQLQQPCSDTNGPGMSRSASQRLQQRQLQQLLAGTAAAGDSSAMEGRSDTLQLQQQQQQQRRGTDGISSSALASELASQQQPHMQSPALASTGAAASNSPLQQLPQQLYEVAAAASSSANSPGLPGTDVQQAHWQLQQQPVQQEQQWTQMAIQGTLSNIPSDALPQQSSLQASSTSSTSPRVSTAVLLPQQQQLTCEASGQVLAGPSPASPSSRQSTRGLTLEDWTLQAHAGQPPKADQQQTAVPSRQPSVIPCKASVQQSVSEVAQLSPGLHLPLRCLARNPTDACGTPRVESPASGRSSRASMVDIVAQTLGPGGTPPPAGVTCLDYLGSPAADLSPRGSLVARSYPGSLSPKMPSARLYTALNASIAEAEAVVAAAVRTAAVDSTAASPRPSAQSAGSPFAGTAQQTVSVVDSSLRAANASRALSPRLSAVASRQASGGVAAIGTALDHNAASLVASAVEHSDSAVTAFSPSQAHSKACPPRPTTAALQQSPAGYASEAASVRVSSTAAFPVLEVGSAAAVSPGRASGCATPATRKALAELQGQLVVLAVEKAALEKQVQIGLGEMQHLQQQAALKAQLEVMVQQMQQDLLLAQERLQQAGNDAQQQKQQNQQQLAQMQEAQLQLASQRAQEAHAAAAEALSCRALLHRTLQHFHQAAKTAALLKDLQALAVQHRQHAVQQNVLKIWRSSARLSKGVRGLQGKSRRQMLQAGLRAWRSGTALCRLAAEQNSAARAHWSLHTCCKVLVHWHYFTYHVKQLGLEVPSSPSTASDAVGAELDYLQQENHEQAADTGPADADEAVQQSLKQEASRASLRSLSALLGPVLISRTVASRTSVSAAQAHKRMQQQQMSPASTARRLEDKAYRTACDGRRSQASLCGISPAAETATACGGALSSCARGSHKPSAVQTRPLAPELPAMALLGWSDMQQASSNRHSSFLQPQSMPEPARARSRSLFTTSANSPKQRSRSISFAAGSARTAAGQVLLRRSAAGSHEAAGQPAGAVGGVPLEVQLAFLNMARAQRLRRRRLLLKGWSRWQCFLEVQAEQHQQLAAAARHSDRHQLRRSWLRWLEFIQQQQYKNLHPDGLNHWQLKLLQQHSKSKQAMLLLQVLQAWWALAQRALAARTAANAAQEHKQRRLLRSILRILQQRVQYSIHKHQLLHKAHNLRTQQLLRFGIARWRHAVTEARAADPSRNQASQQTLWKAVLHWKLVAAAAEAAATKHQLFESFTSRVAAQQRARVFAAWHLQAVQVAKEQQQERLQKAEQQLILLQQQSQSDQQQQAAGLEAVKAQMQQLQVQLEAALASRAQLEQAAQSTEQQLQQQVSSCQQQLAQMSAEHHAAVAVMQQQVEQAAGSTEETAVQLEQLQQQQVAAALEQQLKQQQVEYEVDQYRQRQQHSDQQQQELQQQLVASKSQSKQLAGQLKRCSEKLDQQTEVIQNLQTELQAAREQAAAARHASRERNLSLTHQALAAEQEKLKSRQELCSEQAAVTVLTQQVQELGRELQKQRDAAAAMQAQHGEKENQLMEQLGLKDQAIAQLQDRLADVQQQSASEQAQVFAEIAQLRSGWSQAKQIIKQQRKTLKAQERQLQLALEGTAGMLPHAAQQQQYLAAVQVQELPRSSLADVGASLAVGSYKFSVVETEGANSERKYPITDYVLQQQQQHPRKGQTAGRTTAIGPNTTVAAKPSSLASCHNADAAVETSRSTSAPFEKGLVSCIGNALDSLRVSQQQHKQHSCRRGSAVLCPPVTPGSSMGGLGLGNPCEYVQK